MKRKPGNGLESDGGGRDVCRFVWAEEASLSKCHSSRNLFEEKSQPGGMCVESSVPGRGSSKFEGPEVKVSPGQRMQSRMNLAGGAVTGKNVRDEVRERDWVMLAPAGHGRECGFNSECDWVEVFEHSEQGKGSGWGVTCSD